MLHREMLIDGHFIGGPCDQGTGKSVVKSPWDGSIVGTAAEGGWNDANAALGAAHRAFETWRHAPRHVRQALLRQIAATVRERGEELAQLAVAEIGKPIVWARGEVARLAVTFDVAAEVLERWTGEWVPLEFDARGKDYSCRVERFPIGTVLGIVPYNWPFNLAAHKIAPALATGNTIVVKPSQQALLCTLTLIRLIHEAGCPPGVVNAVNVPGKMAERMALDPRVKMVSFTGSPDVGWHLKEVCHSKRVSLELGGDATVILDADGDLGAAVPKIVAGKFGYAGQICISVQHVVAHEAIADEAKQRLAEATKACPAGDPSDEATVCGPMISKEAADKVEAWAAEAVAMGAKELVPLKRDGNLIYPTLLADVPAEAKLAHLEVFGPILTFASVPDFSAAIARVNASDYGIHCGVFTGERSHADQAYRDLEVGGVVINDTPTVRFDNMPYGGVKMSGFGREGVPYAMQEMTESKARLERRNP